MVALYAIIFNFFLEKKVEEAIIGEEIEGEADRINIIFNVSGMKLVAITILVMLSYGLVLLPLMRFEIASTLYLILLLFIVRVRSYWLIVVPLIVTFFLWALFIKLLNVYFLF